MTGSAKQSRSRAKELDCFVASLLAMTALRLQASRLLTSAALTNAQ